jgi:hypothetical protein
MHKEKDNPKKTCFPEKFHSPWKNVFGYNFFGLFFWNFLQIWNQHKILDTFDQACGAGTGRNRIHLGISEPYSEYGSSPGNKEIKQTTQKKIY